MPRRFQFSLRDLTWLIVAVAAFLGGMHVQSRIDKPELLRRIPAVTQTYEGKPWPVVWEEIELHDGSKWQRTIDDPTANTTPSENVSGD